MADFDSSRHHFSGSSGPMVRLETLSSKSPDRCVHGWLYLESPIPVSAGRVREAHVAQLTIREANRNGSDREEALTSAVPPGAWLLVVEDRDNRLLTTDLHVRLPVEAFNHLWQSGDAVRIDFTGELVGVSYEPIALAGERPSFDAQLSHFGLNQTSRSTKSEDWIAKREAANLLDACDSLYLDGGYGNQVGQIVAELCDSAGTLVRSQDQRQVALAQISRIVSQLRPAFKLRREVTGATEDGIWYFEKGRFLEHAAELGADEAVDIKVRYDYLWQHFDINRVIVDGEARAGAIGQKMDPSVEDLEEVARYYLAMKGLHSRTLTWALVDALIYCECIAFAQTIVSGQSLLGIAVPGELVGLKWMKQAFRSLLATSGSLLVEGAKIGATVAIAALLGRGNEQVVWTIATGVTAARWVVKAVRPVKKRQEVSLELLEEMVAIHNLLKIKDFNAVLLKDQLYRVTAKRAGFSPWVYGILDASAPK